MNNTPTPVILQPTDSAVDLSGFLDAAAGDEREERELLALFLEQVDSKLPKLQVALANGDLHEPKVISHSLAGAASTCGLMTFSRSLRELEMQAGKNEIEAARTEFQNTSILATEIAGAIKQRLGH